MTEDEAVQLFTKRAIAGMEYLDRVKPGWIELINLATLAMIHAECCIIGQLFGNYWDYMPRGDGHSPIWMGFQADGEECEEPYGVLTDVWRALISERRGV